MNELLTEPQAAELLGVGARTLWRWEIEGRCPRAIRPAGSAAKRYRRGDLVDWMDRRCPDQSLPDEKAPDTLAPR